MVYEDLRIRYAIRNLKAQAQGSECQDLRNGFKPAHSRIDIQSIVGSFSLVTWKFTVARTIAANSWVHERSLRLDVRYYGPAARDTHSAVE
jgi:hypothetical protein